MTWSYEISPIINIGCHLFLPVVPRVWCFEIDCRTCDYHAESHNSYSKLVTMILALVVFVFGGESCDQGEVFNL